MPSPWSFQLAWPELVVVALVSAAYAHAQRTHPASRVRVACFAASMLLVIAVLVTPLATLALHYLVVAHLLQNVVLAEWAPALAVLGLSPGMAAAIGRPAAVRVLTHPLVALPLWLAVYAVWHVPAVYEAALRHGPLLFLEHLTYFIAGALFWWPVLRPETRDVPSGAKAAYLFAAFVFASPIGLLLAVLPRPVYDFYVVAPRIWGIEPLWDQQLGGILMAGSEAVVFFVAFVFYFARFVDEES
jgi:putative membrane protein